MATYRPRDLARHAYRLPTPPCQPHANTYVLQPFISDFHDGHAGCDGKRVGGGNQNRLSTKDDPAHGIEGPHPWEIPALLALPLISSRSTLWRVDGQSFDHQMRMIAHEAVGIAAPPLLVTLLSQQVQEPGAVDVVEKDGLLRIAARGEVVERAGKLLPSWTGHGS